MVSYDLVRY